MERSAHDSCYIVYPRIRTDGSQGKLAGEESDIGVAQAADIWDQRLDL